MAIVMILCLGYYARQAKAERDRVQIGMTVDPVLPLDVGLVPGIAPRAGEGSARGPVAAGYGQWICVQGDTWTATSIELL
jgi:hypothetical protein